MNTAQKHRVVGLVLLVWGVLSAGNADAQEGNYYTVRDFELWTGAQIKYKFAEGWSLNFDYEYRFKENAAVMDRNLFDLGLKRKIGDHFSIAMAGRFIRKNDTEGNNQGIDNYFRWNADLGYKTKIERFTIASRLRYQAGNELGVDDIFAKALRLKLGGEYNIKKWKLDPEFSTEIFRVFSYQKGLDKIRFTLGTSYNMKKFGKVTGFFRMEKDFFGAYPPTTNIVGIRYQYTFKKKKNEY